MHLNGIEESLVGAFMILKKYHVSRVVVDHGKFKNLLRGLTGNGRAPAGTDWPQFAGITLYEESEFHD